MNQTKREIASNRTTLLVDISSAEMNEAKALAKKKGMTLQGWAAQLIRKKLEEDREAVNG